MIKNGTEFDLIDFVDKRIDKRSLNQTSLEKLEALSKRFAYQYCQLNKADYYKTQEKILDALRRLKCRPECFLID
ncbi:hypothetical protein ABES80_12290 [Bacillus gobiensis]|uniref:hypothetical protein n=1 Tax=Bacillus gobiensis TaxID=1441095 RepID=UPI003D2231B4